MKKSATGFFFLAIAVAVFFVWTDPLLKDIDGKKSEKELFEDALASSRELQTLRDSLLAKFNAVSSEDLNRLSKMLPSESQVAELLVEITDVASENGMLVTEFNTQETVKQATRSGLASSEEEITTQEIIISLGISASYENFVSFLEKIESSLRLIEVDGIDFSSGDHREEFDKIYDFTIKAKSFFKNE